VFLKCIGESLKRSSNFCVAQFSSVLYCVWRQSHLSTRTMILSHVANISACTSQSELLVELGCGAIPADVWLSSTAWNDSTGRNINSCIRITWRVKWSALPDGSLNWAGLTGILSFLFLLCFLLSPFDIVLIAADDGVGDSAAPIFADKLYEKGPTIMTDLHGHILLWYLPEILSRAWQVS